MIPAAAARPAPMAKVNEMIRLLLMDTSELMTLSWAVARMAIPILVLNTRMLSPNSRKIVMLTIIICK